MAMTDEELLLQMEILTSKTDSKTNPNMVYKSSTILNKGLNPDYFSGNYTKIVNALNQLAEKSISVEQSATNVGNKVNSILLDTSVYDNQLIWEDLQNKMGQPTIIQGLTDLFDGKMTQSVLNISADDIDKVLSVGVDGEGNPFVKAIDIAASSGVSSLVELEYSNRYVSNITNAKEAMDYVINAIINGEIDAPETPSVPTEVSWDMIKDRPEVVADKIELTNTHLELKDGDTTVSSVQLASDSDIEDIMNDLHVEEEE